MMHSPHRPMFWRSILGVVLFGSIVALVAAGATAAGAASASTQTPRDGADIDETQLKSRTTPVQCTANQTVELDGALLKVDRAAIQTSGNCSVHITNSRIVARAAVIASGNSEITFENCIVEGALNLTGDSVASFKSSTVRGRVRKLQSATVKDLGHNVWH
jgi:hypothetical protein